jgi:hypothetical protein
VWCYVWRCLLLMLPSCTHISTSKCLGPDIKPNVIFFSYLRGVDICVLTQMMKSANGALQTSPLTDKIYMQSLLFDHRTVIRMLIDYYIIVFIWPETVSKVLKASIITSLGHFQGSIRTNINHGRIPHRWLSTINSVRTFSWFDSIFLPAEKHYWYHQKIIILL